MFVNTSSSARNKKGLIRNTLMNIRLFRGLNYQFWDLILPFQFKKLAYYSFMGAGRRREDSAEGPDGWLHTEQDAYRRGTECGETDVL